MKPETNILFVYALVNTTDAYGSKMILCMLTFNMQFLAFVYNASVRATQLGTI